ncbi:zf-HC2 domain-containing protein [Streptomyces rimosus]|uniref:zf-HC2 domain-containing protein n=1 Tax=Streptomyces rimosus TaxID=1927 RepID=UPI00099D6DB0|nr:zf-HC2 domain-containing protein [Streptomyces rimosus]
MQCSRVRTALSARLDGEQLPPGVTGGRLDAHVAGCADCRRWSAEAARLQRLTRSASDAADDGGGGGADAAALDGLLDRLRGSSVRGDAVRGEAVRGDAVWGDAVRGGGERS